ncbi:MAG: single-stranded-DNA-specific exonuclease RecJ, partial [Alphaproteobacteria bacterium]
MAAPARKGLDTFQEPELPAFLGVENSARGRRWLPRLNDAQQNAATALAQQHGLSLLQARVFVARGATADTLDDFLRPTIRNLMPDPLTLRDMDKGAARLAAAIRKREPVAVFGDYDVDGAASASLMTLFLRHHGVEPRIYIPDRITEGYGPNTQAFTGLVEDGASLIVTVDCGTTAHEAVAAATALGTDVVIVDHHLAGESLPQAEAVINPNRQDDLSQLGHLCAAGVTFMLLVATARLLRQEGWYEDAGRRECDLMELVDLVALATVCDVVPLTGLNRAFVRTGLTRLHRRENRGLNALCDVSALAAAPSAYHLGFVLGPRINAGGRIGDSSLGVRLLTCSDDLEAAAIAEQLDRLNSERKAMEAAFLEDALAQADRMLAQSPD